jgi:hypothetical protein
MANPVEFMLTDVREKYEAMPSSRAFDRLYDDPEWGHMFAVLHKRLNEHFTAITVGRRQPGTTGPTTAGTCWRS